MTETSDADRDGAQRYRDFAHTVRVITARSLAEHDAADDLPVVRYSLSLVAAAGATGINLPVGEVLVEGRQLGIRFEPRLGELEVTLQLKGIAALKAHRRQIGRLTSLAGLFDVVFQFSDRGLAVCVVPDNVEVRQALSTCMIEIQTARI